MDAVLKKEIQEIVELVKTMPDSLQVRALEMLMQDLLDRQAGKTANKGGKDKEDDDEKDKPDKKPLRRESTSLDSSTLPMRVKAFMKKHEVTAGQIEKLFHIEGKQYEPIWTVETTKFSKAQIQIALLQSLQHALTSGEFSFDREEVKTECKNKNCYDGTNFKANFTNNQKYFSGLDKEAGVISLTDEGMKALAAIVVRLAGSGDAK
jgi:hypothetical protein